MVKTGVIHPPDSSFHFHKSKEGGQFKLSMGKPEIKVRMDHAN